MTIDLKSCFEQAYRYAIKSFSDLPFLVTYTLREVASQKTYSEFDSDVRYAMSFILARSSGLDTVVTVAGNHYEHLVFIFASWRLGLTVCPINPEELPTRIADKVAKVGGNSLVLSNSDMTSYHSFPLATQGPLQSSQKVSTLIFTSGSTGHSKIVEQREISILANARDLIEAHQLSPGRVVATPLPVYHVNALHFSVVCSFLSGAKLVLLEKFVLPQVWQVLEAERVNIFSAVPQIFKHMVMDCENAKGFNLEAWQYGVSAAAPLSHDLARAFQTQFGRKLIQGYGLSEAVNFSCLTPPSIDDLDYQKLYLDVPRPSIGCALSCNEVRLVDSEGVEIQEPDTQGEICLSGINVMRGYRGEERPSVVHGEFRTGDLGFFKFGSGRQKFFYLSGRLKEIAKRGGLTVSLLEIDECLSGVEGVDDVMAVRFEHLQSGEEVGVVVQTHLPVEEMLAHFNQALKAQLPVYMRPTLLLLTSEALRSSSGKLLRTAFKTHLEPYSNFSFGRKLQVLDLRPAGEKMSEDE